MLKNPPSPQYELEMISLEQLVPKDHLVRKVAKAIDFEFIRDEVAHLYCQTIPRTSLCPLQRVVESTDAMLPCCNGTKYQEDSPCAIGFFTLFMAQPLSICGNGKKIHKTDRLNGYPK